MLTGTLFQYDMITARITNSRFHKRIQEAIARARSEKRLHIHIDALTADEVNIRPGQYMSSVIAFVSTWIEVETADSLLAHVSRQVLDLELAYAAFCGLSHVVIPSPKFQENIAEYAQAINTALSRATYMQLLIQLSIDDWVGDENSLTENVMYDAFSAWDSWNTIRTVCKYNTQLAIGKPCTPP
jgi:protein arginine N-methyltransferase 5